MFRNSEGYADPTAGAALKHICYTERQEKRNNNPRQHSAVQKKASKNEPRKGREKSLAQQQRNMAEKTIKWIQVWPKDQAGRVFIEHRMEKKP